MVDRGVVDINAPGNTPKRVTFSFARECSGKRKKKASEASQQPKPPLRSELLWPPIAPTVHHSLLTIYLKKIVLPC
jgi:hypothetical protein